jgi:hypothetical protein
LALFSIKPPFGHFQKWGMPKTIGFNTTVVIHDLDDLGVSLFQEPTPFIGLSSLTLQVAKKQHLVGGFNPS